MWENSTKLCRAVNDNSTLPGMYKLFLKCCCGCKGGGDGEAGGVWKLEWQQRREVSETC